MALNAFEEARIKQKQEFWKRMNETHTEMRNPPGRSVRNGAPGLAGNVIEAQANLDAWMAKARNAPEAIDDETRWERNLIFAHVSQYAAEVKHWTEMRDKEAPQVQISLPVT